MKTNILKLILIATLFLNQLNEIKAQEAIASHQFWDQLNKHCGRAYEGEIMTPSENDPFTGKKLLIHFISCDNESRTMKIPFHVGEDRSRTWVLTWEKNGFIQLKHDHRHEDGSEDEVTQYGGTSTNVGLPNLQMFPADEETSIRIPYASHNVWWFGVDETSLTYNLRRIGSDRYFSVKFDLTKPVEIPAAPWGWKN